MRLIKITMVGAAFVAGIYFQAAEAVTLKQNSIITGSTIMLGDVFDGLEHSQSKVLGPAPLPGKDMVLNARTLMRIAIALDLPWRPESNMEEVVLRRSATVIGRDTVERSIRDSLVKRGVNGDFEVAMTTPLEDIVLPENETGAIEFERFNYSPSTNRFEGTIVAPSRNNPLYTALVSGSVQRLVEIPVLREPLRAGSIIGVRDLDHISVKESTLQPAMILNANALVGMTPRTLISSGVPIKANDIEPPEAVSRGELVMMIFQNGPLVLTAQGKALENGAQGDVVRVLNTASNKTVQALVTGDNEVTLQSN